MPRRRSGRRAANLFPFRKMFVGPIRQPATPRRRRLFVLSIFAEVNMPTRSTACRCGGTISGGKCNRCKRLQHRAPEIARPSAHRRHYGRPWRKTRDAFLKQNPFCSDCAAKGFPVEVAVDVHHLKKVSDRLDLLHDHKNLLPLCKRCHTIRTRRGE